IDYSQADSWKEISFETAPEEYQRRAIENLQNDICPCEAGKKQQYSKTKCKTHCY
ncbi:unnamed protein product, partial [marine sediment metagenome]